MLPATVRPWQTTTLHARVSGYLRAWHHALGAQVKAGELLAEIDTPELDQELAEAKALAREAAAAAVQAKAERTEAEADLKVAEGQLARIQADMDLVKSQLARREKLVTNSTITREEYDTFRKQTDARTADVSAAQADVTRRRLPQNGSAWTVATNTVSMRVDGPHVAVVNEQDQIEMKAVRLGRDLGARVVVLEGISGGERLVVNPTDDLTSGVRVEVNQRREPGQLAQR